MSVWLQNVLTDVANSDSWGQETLWLKPKRQQSLALLQTHSWPTRKTEDWKYTPLKVLERTDLNAISAEPAALVGKISGLDTIDLVFVDGRFDANQSTFTSLQGLSIVSLAEADEATQSWALELFSKIKPERHLFGLLNDLLCREGMIIDVAPGCKIDKPIRLVQQLSAGAEAHTRLLVRLGEGAQASVIEHYMGSASSFNTGVAEYSIGMRAKLEHYRFALQTDAAMSIGGCYFELGEKSALNSTLIAFGSTLSRVDVDIHHAGEFAHAKFNTIYLLDGTELFDLHATVEHAVANGITEENIRCIVAGHARAVFNGRIHIHRNAQKTLAELNNRNLLLSDHAEINTKPELEIYADDVRCAHGATIAAIDEQALYYLQSRGISRGAAQVLLSFGFINELVDQMPNALLAEWLRPQLRERFAQMKVN